MPIYVRGVLAARMNVQNHGRLTQISSLPSINPIRFPDKRHEFFSGVCTHLTENNPEEQALRCSLLQGLRGNVLELGPGPATNAACFVGKAAVRSYTGIEPNTYFHPIFRNKMERLGLTFPTELLTLEGEKLDLPDESFDQV